MIDLSHTAKLIPKMARITQTSGQAFEVQWTAPFRVIFFDWYMVREAPEVIASASDTTVFNLDDIMGPGYIEDVKHFSLQL